MQLGKWESIYLRGNLENIKENYRKTIENIKVNYNTTVYNSIMKFSDILKYLHIFRTAREKHPILIGCFLFWYK